MTFSEVTTAIADEIRDTVSRLNEQDASLFTDAIQQAGAVFVTGEGRSGLVARCFAMRLMHLGLRSHVVGGATTPRLQRGDLLVAISRTGETPLTCAVARVASEQGGTVAAVTAGRSSTLASSAELTVLLPKVPSRQYGGSLFEQSALILLDAVALVLQQRLGATADQMDSRHANLE